MVVGVSRNSSCLPIRYTSIRMENLDLLREIGFITKELAKPNIIAACRKDFNRRGIVFPNCSFHAHEQSQAPIAPLNKLPLRAYGPIEEPLLEQVRKIRIGSAHEIEPDLVNILQRVCRFKED